MACINYKVMSCELECTIDLMRVALCSSDVMYKKVPFDVITSHHGKVRCICLLYRTGKIICYGNKPQLNMPGESWNWDILFI